jgi:hypothetical protein
VKKMTVDELLAKAKESERDAKSFRKRAQELQAVNRLKRLAAFGMVLEELAGRELDNTDFANFRDNASNIGITHILALPAERLSGTPAHAEREQYPAETDPPV